MTRKSLLDKRLSHLTSNERSALLALVSHLHHRYGGDLLWDEALITQVVQDAGRFVARLEHYLHEAG